jgi:hypothetical protein
VLVRTLLRVLAVFFCTVLLWTGKVPAKAQQAVGHYFPQTGHNVTGEFWSFYQSVPDAEVIFGMPITEQFTSRDGSGLAVQYFEKSRFELHPEMPEGQRVQLSPLGTKMYEPGLPALNLTTPGACRILNGFGICYDFLAFFDRYGGMERFGNPLSSFEFQPDGRLVQYFEKARFEWHPEMAAGQTVALADFGRIYANNHEDPARFNSALPLSNIPVQLTPPLSLKVQAFSARAVTQPDDTQKVFVVVQDQTLGPVFGATGTVTVHLTTGEELTYPIVTDEAGLAVVPSLSYIEQIPGSRIILNVSVSYQGLRASTTTSFLIWR